jgi:hypothetical protein
MLTAFSHTTITSVISLTRAMKYFLLDFHMGPSQFNVCHRSSVKLVYSKCSTCTIFTVYSRSGSTKSSVVSQLIIQSLSKRSSSRLSSGSKKKIYYTRSELRHLLSGIASAPLGSQPSCRRGLSHSSARKFQSSLTTSSRLWHWMKAERSSNPSYGNLRRIRRPM